MKKIATLSLSVFLLASCGPMKPGNLDSKDTSASQISDNGNSITMETDTTGQQNLNPIMNKYWKLKTLEGKPVKMTASQEREQYFTLKSDGTVIGFAGCNQFNGTYTLQNGNRIHFDENLAVTMKACADNDINEHGFLQIFTLADNYTINGDTLNLYVARRAPLAVFEAVYF